MSLTSRIAISSLDDVVSSAELNVPDAAVVQVAWSRTHQSGAVMGLFDDDGVALDVKSDMLARLTGLIARPVPGEALAWAYPDADLSSGSVLLNVSVHETASALFAQTVIEQLQVGLRVPDDAVRDALWLSLTALALPAGSVRLERLVLVPELPADAVFAVVQLRERADGSGASVSWQSAVADVPVSVSSGIAALANELAVRAEREASLRGTPTVLTDVTIPL